ncbi:unnamed protein product [Pipistrellus nathusii]|uniref:Uncharacterized protein n=1 Tax=Pipistrellus nathusii TaxID=59473 RepID=A0ABP0A5M3_PIPNA
MTASFASSTKNLANGVTGSDADGLGVGGGWSVFPHRLPRGALGPQVAWRPEIPGSVSAAGLLVETASGGFTPEGGRGAAHSAPSRLQTVSASLSATKWTTALEEIE